MSYLFAQSRPDRFRVPYIAASIWLTDVGTFDEFNEVYDAWVVPGNTPVRCVFASQKDPSHSHPAYTHTNTLLAPQTLLPSDPRSVTTQRVCRVAAGCAAVQRRDSGDRSHARMMAQ